LAKLRVDPALGRRTDLAITAHEGATP
jgi:hypothetical protein